jgi:hypothetical protein
VPSRASKANQRRGLDPALAQFGHAQRAERFDSLPSQPSARLRAQTAGVQH